MAYQSSDPIPLKWQGKIFGVYLFVIIPLACIFLIDEVTPALLGLMVGVWYIQMVGVLIGFHRFFSHRSFKAGRKMQFALGLIGCLGGQKGPIFWASQHRHHHKHCEDHDDRHSPFEYGNLKGWNFVKGFLWSHFGSIWKEGPPPIEDRYVKDLLKFPELHWLEKQSTGIYYGFGLLIFLCGGVVSHQNGPGFMDGAASATIWGFFIPTFLSWNCVMLVNSAVHVWGSMDFVSKISPACNARNIWWLSIPLLGDNWHNNHHADMNSARAGFYWWQIDLNYYLILLWEKMGLVWDIKGPDWERLERFNDWKENVASSDYPTFVNPRAASLELEEV